MFLKSPRDPNSVIYDNKEYSLPKILICALLLSKCCKLHLIAFVVKSRSRSCCCHLILSATCYSKEEQAAHHQTFEECIDENSVNVSEVINDVFLGWNGSSLHGRKDLIEEGLAPTIESRAKYFTINVGGKIGPDYKKEQLFVELLYNGSYEVFIHDPRFFILNYIPVALPTIFRVFVVDKTESHFYPMIMTEVEELNLPQDPCNKDEKYDFQVDQFVWL